MAEEQVVFPPGLETFRSLEEFYSADERRRFSGEADYGLYWWDGPQGYSDTWRVSAIAETGEFYAIQEQCYRRPYPERPQVVLLGSFEAKSGPQRGDRVAWYEDADRILEGWNLECGKGSSLAWILERVVDPSLLERARLSILLRHQQLGNHVHAEVFVGRQRGSRGRAGEMILEVEEWELFRSGLEKGLGDQLEFAERVAPEARTG